MKYALITGANGGLGRLAVEALVNNKYIVFATDYNIDGLEKTKNIIPIKMDVTDSFSIEKCFDEVSKITVNIDVILNFAGILTMNALIEADMNEVERIFNINVFGTMRVNKAFFPLILKNKGRIINIGSEVQRFTPVPFNGLYTMTKYSIDAYNDSLRRELNYLDIKVIKILPGSFKSNMHNAARDNQKNLIKNTKYFKEEIKSLSKMMDSELNNTNDPKYLVDAILDAVNNPKPKIKYIVKNARNQKLINILPETLIDKIFKKSI